MANEFFNATSYPGTRAQGSSASMRAQLAAIAAGFDKLPALTGNGGKVVAINSGGTAIGVAAGLSVSGNNVSVVGTLSAGGAVAFNGAVTLGDAAGDAVTIAGSAITWSGNPTHSGNHTFSGNATFNGDTTIGNAAGDALTIASSSVTWSGNPSHSGNHTFAGNINVGALGNVSFDGNVTLGGSGKTITFVSTSWSISGGSATVSGSLALTGNLNTLGDLQVAGNTTIGNAAGDTLTVHPSAVTWQNNPTHSGNHTFSGSLSLSSGAIAPGSYTPTFTAVANVAATTANGNVMTLRLGNTMFVAGVVDIDPTSASTTTTVGISLPVASNLSAFTQLAGGAVRVSGGLAALVGGITGDQVNDRAQITFLNDADVSNRSWSFWFTYPII